ncbi:MAG: glycosyltransferase [Romboutsia sp.]|uniref:glycosyltransferase n=1 Tax=Romboutsia sp. TaxID=1965302 RepID=UPI003F3B647D
MFDSTISLCMIVKNEEKNLRRCLESTKNLVDEIIIVDTGSTDKTIEIAKEYNAKIYYHEWTNNFSDARNASLEKATKNWILFLDADEEITSEEGQKLKNILENNSHLEAFHLRLVNIISNSDIGDAIVLRAFKNKPEYRFEGKMHEQIVGSIERSGGPIGATDVKILHYGYDPQFANIKEKQQRNLDLLNSYPESKRDGYFYYSLGNEYARIEDHDMALQTYQKALDIPIKKGERPVYLAYLYLHIAKVLNAAKRFDEEIKRLHAFESNYSDFKDLYFMEYLAQIGCGKISKAKDALEKYINCKGGSYEYPSCNFEKHYNMEELLEKLKLSSIPMPDKTLSVLILAYEDNVNLVECVKSVNEIAYEVIIATPKDSNINRNALENVGATIVDVKHEDKKNVFMRGYFKCKGKYILLMKPDEVCSASNLKALGNLLLNTQEQYFNLLVVNTKTNITNNEFRLFENLKILKKINNFDEFANYIHSNKIDGLEICINKV